jgi:4-amino-4-deoxy-L-arabinose transferase-like glycosyltransferase
MASTNGESVPGPEPRPGPGARFLPPVAFALALALLAAILVRSLGAAPSDASSDDGYYLRYMERVGSQGLVAFPKLFEQWNGNEDHWKYPPPSRIGFVVASALWSKLFGASLVSLQKLSLASHLLLVALNYLFARRRFGEPRALFIGVLIGFSPLLMGISRLALTDSFNALCMTTTIWLFLELLHEPGSWRRAVLFMASLAFMVLVKELSVLLVVPFVAFVLFERFALRVPHDVGRFALCFAIPGLVAAPVFALAAGGVTPLLETTRIVLASPATNAYALQWGSGPWTRAILDYLLLSPWPTLLAIGWFFVQVLRLREGRYERDSVFLGFVAGTLILLLSFFTKNARYTVALELPIRVFTVLLLTELFGRLRSPARNAVVGALVLGIAWIDWRTFDVLWVEKHCYDPITAALAILRHLLPTRGGP